MMSVENSFRAAMREAGIATDAEIIADGKLHRTHVECDKSNSKNAWYVLHDGNHPAGAFGCNKRGISGKWRPNNHVPNTRFNPVDRAQIEAQRNARLMEQERAYSAAAERAAKILHAATSDASNHAYVVRKGVQPFGVHQSRDGVLVIPVYDARSGKLSSVQTIDADGEKRFLPGGRMAYGCSPLRHTAESFNRALEQRIGAAEGWATAATLAHVLGPSIAMFAAFGAGNLANVATALREHYPNAEITIFGDNDESGVGQAAAIKAATTVQGFVAIPPKVGADWNDFARAAA